MFGHVFEISVYKQRNLNFQIHAATLSHPSETGQDGNLRQFNYLQESFNIYMMHEFILFRLISDNSKKPKVQWYVLFCKLSWVNTIIT